MPIIPVIEWAQLTTAEVDWVQTGAGSQGANEANEETPSGAINGSNKVFTWAHTPNPAASLKVFLNGTYRTSGGEDYTLVADIMTFVNAPMVNSILRGFYRY